MKSLEKSKEEMIQEIIESWGRISAVAPELSMSKKTQEEYLNNVTEEVVNHIYSEMVGT